MIYNTLFAVSKVVYFSMALWYILTWLFTQIKHSSWFIIYFFGKNTILFENGGENVRRYHIDASWYCRSSHTVPIL